MLYTRWSTGTLTTKYVTADHLGSSTLVMNDSGGTLVELSFGSYGARRGSNWTGTPTSGDWAQIANSTRQGFTGHEALDAVNFVHMNGRVFEPVLGRFISADPNLDRIFHSQGPNRYAYVRGNPLSFTDPTGWSTESEKTVVNWVNKDEPPTLEPVEVLNSRFDFARDFGFQQAVWTAGFRQFAIAGDGSSEVIAASGDDVVVTAKRINRPKSSTGEPPLPSTESQSECAAAANAPQGWFATNSAFRQNSDRQTRFTFDASQLTIEQLNDFNANGRARGDVQGLDWFVFGTVTLQQHPDGSVTVRPDRYEFEQHGSFMSQEWRNEWGRNLGTYFGFHAATFGGITEYWATLTDGNHATDFTIDFTCHPTIVR